METRIGPRLETEYPFDLLHFAYMVLSLGASVGVAICVNLALMYYT